MRFAPFGDTAPLRILSLGGGVQSSTVLQMSLNGDLPPLDAVINADPGWEPAAVYEHLAYLRQRCEAAGVPYYTVSAGNIREAYYRTQTTNRRYVMLPTHIRNPDGSGGLGKRQCTKEYKLEPLRRQVRVIMAERGVKPRPGVVDQWIGISLDEAHRMKDSRVRYQVNVYPLVDLRMTRQGCLAYLERHGLPIPAKSACIGCPFHGNVYWREMKDRRPEEWAQAVEFDRLIRKGGPRGELIGENYLHRSLVPLDQVDLSTPADRGQLEMFEGERAFGGECEGMCGV